MVSSSVPHLGPPARTHTAGSQHRRVTIAISLVALVALLVPGHDLRPAAAAGPTIVSMTFDDNTADQAIAARLLTERGMSGTFYTNSGRVGRDGYLDAAQLRQMQADGHEIAGHTVGHVDLAATSSDEAARQICDDRIALAGMGLRITSFAYPFSSVNTDVQRLVEQCGFNSARVVGGIQCVNCRTAESIPPRNRWFIETPNSVKSTTSFDDLVAYVTTARAGGGGWVPFVLHGISDSGSHSIAPATLAAFLDWLDEQPDVVVRTVDEVVGGEVKPLVDGPRAETTPLQNASLEETGGANGAPACWLRGGFGANDRTWSRTTDAHTGSYAETVTITSYADGDARLVQPHDLGQCAPSVDAGSVYELGAYYKSTAPVRFSVWRRTTSNTWVFWTQGAPLPAQAQWTPATMVLPEVPSDTVAISFGLSLRTTGTLTTDTYSLVDTTPVPPDPDPGDEPPEPEPDDPEPDDPEPDDPEPPPADDVPPSLSWVSPGEGNTVKGTVVLRVSASDEEELATVTITTPDGVTHEATASMSKGKSPAPTGDWEVAWNTNMVGDGVHGFTAAATDVSGNSAHAQRTLTIRNAKGNPNR